MWLVDAGPPRRAARILDGLADNWTGYVYDPSQTFDSAPKMVFGGRLISSLHLWGPWYYAAFT
jgi:hypothetical protein